jgi:trehalose 6-phosphate phosphatase
MKALEIQAPYNGFLDRLRAAHDRILLLDYDGTLAPFTVERTRALPYPEVPPLLERIMDAKTRVVLITGRAAQELAQLSCVQPHPEIWGSHGAEHLTPDGTYTLAAGVAEYKQGLVLAADCLGGMGIDQHIEAKPGGVALHWRGLSKAETEQLRNEVLQLWLPLLLQYRLKLLEFDGGIELRAPGFTKGDAVRAILAEAVTDAAIAYLGDDITDEDAFEALRGKGLTVLVRAETRLTAADIWLQPPTELIQFLNDWLRACGGEA